MASKKNNQLATEAIEFLQAAIKRRGLSNVKIINIAEQPLPEMPSINCVPYLHYGAIGLNALEGYSAAFFLHGYYIPDEALLKAVFPHIPPSQRPKPRISAHGGRRRITWTGTISDEDRLFAKIMLFRLEADPALQAFGRVRFTIYPRTVVMSVQHHVLSRIGRVTTAKDLKTARAALGCDDTYREQHKHQTKSLQDLMDRGTSLKAAAASLNYPYRTAKRLMAAAKASPDQNTHGAVPVVEPIAEPNKKGPNPIYILYKWGLAPFANSGDANEDSSESTNNDHEQAQLP